MKLRYLIILSAMLVLSVSCKAGTPKRYTVEVVKEYAHDRGAYTQGLVFHDGIMCASTGQYGESTIRQVELSSGKVTRRLDFSQKYFAEGSVVLGGKLYVLTWTNRVAFVYDAATLKYEKTWSYPREGWGLTTDGRSLIASDGSARIFYMDSDFKVHKTLNVSLNGRPVRYLNELEWIDGRIWANVYTTDMIVIINPSSGEVEATVDCAGLLPGKLRNRDTDVLNGIAVDTEGRIYLTGKNWPRLYEVRLVKKTK